MKKISLVLTLLVLSIFTSMSFAFSPIGYWKTIDDVTHQPKSIVHITENNQHQLQGQVVKLFKGALQFCSACSGDKKDKPILGMVVITGLKQNPDNENIWEGGEALDPKSGKIYRCSVTVIDNGQQLNARGYIGIPLFGRTQTWIRVNEKN